MPKGKATKRPKLRARAIITMLKTALDFRNSVLELCLESLGSLRNDSPPQIARANLNGVDNYRREFMQTVRNSRKWLISVNYLSH